MAKRKPLSKRVRFAVLVRDGFRCQYCGADQASGAVLHVDHKHPRARGGSDEMSNLVAACIDCNLGKSSSVIAPRAAAPAEKVETFGISFGDDGRPIEQFVIERVTDLAVEVQPYSWGCGNELRTRILTRDYLTNRCLIFLDEKEWVAAGDHWADHLAFREKRPPRINPRFVRKAASVFD